MEKDPHELDEEFHIAGSVSLLSGDFDDQIVGVLCGAGVGVVFGVVVKTPG